MSKIGQNSDRWVADKDEYQSKKDPLLKAAVVDVIRPFFKQLGNRKFVGGCLKCRIQNIYECYHNVTKLTSAVKYLLHKHSYPPHNCNIFQLNLVPIIFPNSRVT